MALDPNKKFLYFNKDASSTESDESLCFPVSKFIGIETQTSSILDFYFEGSKGVDATTVQVFHAQHAYVKTFMSSLVDEINFGEKAFIKVYDHAERTTHPSDVSINMVTDLPPVFTLEDATIDLGTVLSVENGGTGASTLTDNGVLFGNGTSAISAVGLSSNGVILVGGSTPSTVHPLALAGSGLDATYGNGTLALNVETLNQDTTGSAATLTTARAINGVDFDGSAAITVTAAGSTLSDTVTVAKGGTGATSLTADGVLFGNGTSAISAVDLSTNGNIIVGGSTPAVVTGANLAGSGLAATVGNGTLVLAVETLNQNTTGSAATLTTARAINGVDFDGSAPITVTAAGSTLSDTVTVAKGGTGATTFTSGHILRGNGTSALTSNSDLMFDGNNLTIQSNTSEKPVVSLNSTNSDAEAPVLQFMKGTAGADGDDLGKINFEGFDPDGNQHIFAQALGEIVVAANGSEEGKLTLNVASHDAELQPGLILASGNAEDEVDVTIGNGATSVVTVPGSMSIGDANDTFTIDTGAAGATTLTTTDTSAAAAHFEIAADGNITLDAEGDVVLEADDITISTRSITHTNTQTDHGTSYTIQSTTDSAAVKNILQFSKDKGAAGADDDIVGEIQFQSDNSAQELLHFAKIQAEVKTAADTDEAGRLNLQVATSNGSTSALQDGVILSGHGTSDIIDTTIGYGASSTTTIAGDLKVNGTDIYGPTDGDLQLRSDGNIALFLDGDGDESSQFQVINDASGPIFTVTEAGVGALNNQTIVTGGKIAVASEAQAPIGMHIARRTITTAEANAMNSTPIQLIPARGANTVIEISNVIARVDRAATQTNSAADMNLHYADKEPGTYGSSSICHFRRFAYNETTDVVERRVIAETTSALTLTEDVNKAVEVSFDAATTTNCFTSIDMYVTYYVIDIS